MTRHAHGTPVYLVPIQVDGGARLAFPIAVATCIAMGAIAMLAAAHLRTTVQVEGHFAPEHGATDTVILDVPGNVVPCLKPGSTLIIHTPARKVRAHVTRAAFQSRDDGTHVVTAVADDFRGMPNSTVPVDLLVERPVRELLLPSKWRAHDSDTRCSSP